jgi:predicted DNA-binding transcriptional regulator YafY
VASALSLRVKTCPELDMWVLGLGENIEVLKPADVRDRVARRIQAMSRIDEENRQLALL